MACIAVRYPAAFVVFQHVCFEPSVPLRQQVLGLQFLHHSCEVSSPEQLQEAGVGKAFALLLLKKIEDPSLKPDIQCLSYSALGKLARRIPSYFRDNFDLLEKLFRATLLKDEKVRANVRDALAMMKEACVLLSTFEVKELV